MLIILAIGSYGPEDYIWFSRVYLKVHSYCYIWESYISGRPLQISWVDQFVNLNRAGHIISIHTIKLWNILQLFCFINEDKVLVVMLLKAFIVLLCWIGSYLANIVYLYNFEKKPFLVQSIFIKAALKIQREIYINNF